jgi:DNA polymerase-3 subunit epsilon
MRSETLPLFGAAWATPVPRAEPVHVEPPLPAPAQPAKKRVKKTPLSPASAATLAAVAPVPVAAPVSVSVADSVAVSAPVAVAVSVAAADSVAVSAPVAVSVAAADSVADAVSPRPERGVVVFDVETTGTDRRRDQVIELCVQFGLSEGAPSRTWRIKPDVTISPGAQAVHGISMADLADCPRFGDVVDEIAAVFASAEVVVGYNLIFDIDMVSAEFERLGRPLPDWSSKTIVDPFRLWQQCEPRSLSHAHKRFVGSGFEAAHSATADVAATGRVLAGMLRSFGLDEHDWRGVAGVCDPQRPSWVGPSRHLQWQGERVVLAFGKHSGTPLSQIDPGYLRWMAEKDFPAHVGIICKKASELAEPEFLAWVRGAYGAPPAA